MARLLRLLYCERALDVVLAGGFLSSTSIQQCPEDTLQTVNGLQAVAGNEYISAICVLESDEGGGIFRQSNYNAVQLARATFAGRAGV